jgi:hypothetical protein
MTLGARVFLGAFVGVVIVFAWLFRIDAKTGAAGTAVVTDHWTGTVYDCSMGGGCYLLYPKKPIVP